MIPGVEQCNLFESDGTRCPNYIARETSYINEDLCPEHRREFERQQEEWTSTQTNSSPD